MRPIVASLLALAVASVPAIVPVRATMTPASPINFTLSPAGRPGVVELALRSEGQSSDHVQSAVDGLVGLDPAAIDRGGPVGFAVVRDAGRLDCAGTSDRHRARGRCRFAPDAGFADFLAARGMARPTYEQAFALTLTGASRGLVQAIADARYPVPTPGQLAGLAALGIDRNYIAALAGHGYRPARIEGLMSMKAVGVTPDYVDALGRAGYRALSADAIVQLRALGVTPAYLAGLAAAGYPRLSPDEVAQLRAMNVTGAWIERIAPRDHARIPVATLVRMKAVGAVTVSGR